MTDVSENCPQMLSLSLVRWVIWKIGVHRFFSTQLHCDIFKEHILHPFGRLLYIGEQTCHLWRDLHLAIYFFSWSYTGLAKTKCLFKSARNNHPYWDSYQGWTKTLLFQRIHFVFDVLGSQCGMWKYQLIYFEKLQRRNLFEYCDCVRVEDNNQTGIQTSIQSIWILKHYHRIVFNYLSAADRPSAITGKAATCKAWIYKFIQFPNHLYIPLVETIKMHSSPLIRGALKKKEVICNPGVKCIGIQRESQLLSQSAIFTHIRGFTCSFNVV